MFERFTDRARRVVVLAQEESRLLNHNYIGTEHILLGLVHEGEGVAALALDSLGVSLEATRQRVEGIIGTGQAPPHGHIPFTPRAKKVLELALREALQLDHNYIGTEHILLGLVREGEGVAAQVLIKSGADLGAVREEVIRILGGYAGTPEDVRMGEADVHEQVIIREGSVGVTSPPPGRSHKGPRCPRCRASLEQTARVATQEVPDGDGATHPVRFVFCSACGESLLASDS